MKVHQVHKNSLVSNDISSYGFGAGHLRAIKLPKSCCFDRRRYFRISELLQVVAGTFLSFPSYSVTSPAARNASEEVISAVQWNVRVHSFHSYKTEPLSTVPGFSSKMKPGTVPFLCGPEVQWPIGPNETFEEINTKPVFVSGLKFERLVKKNLADPAPNLNVNYQAFFFSS